MSRLKLIGVEHRVETHHNGQALEPVLLVSDRLMISHIGLGTNEYEIRSLVTEYPTLRVDCSSDFPSF